MRISVIASLTAAATAGTALAQPALPLVGEFTETFDNGLGGFEAGGTFDDPFIVTEGGNSFARVVATPSGPFATVIANNNAPGSQFVGDYRQPNVVVSFDVRHDASAPVVFGLRLATVGNFPAVIGSVPGVVAPGSFQTLSFDIDPSNPLLDFLGTPPDVILSSITRIQLFTIPTGPPATSPISYDFDNITVTPAPAGAAALALGGVLAARRRR